jgi:UDP-N-acetylglucosamine 1-carboxyvinyltransferase
MEKVIKINGGNQIGGEVSIGGAKNSVVALLPAMVLVSKGKVRLDNIPQIEDVNSIFSILRYLNVKIEKKTDNCYEFDASEIEYKDLDIPEAEKFRASYYFMGSMLARFGKAKVGLPGGCFLGPRPIDLHIKGFKSLGVDIKNEYGNYSMTAAPAEDGQKDRVFLDFPSVGATINIILAAVIGKKEIEIENAAKEPEITDLCLMLNHFGAKIKGAGTDTIKINGVEALTGAPYQVVPDRIEAASYIILGVAANADLKITNLTPQHLESVTAKLLETGANLEIYDETVHVKPIEKPLKPIKMVTQVFPGFPTDAQQPMTTMLALVAGESRVEDTIYKARFKHCEQLNKMGANIEVFDNHALIHGVENLYAAKVKASDLRAGMALVIAGILAEGTTQISNIYHILRGYEQIITKLTNIGVDIWLEDKN